MSQPNKQRMVIDTNVLIDSSQILQQYKDKYDIVLSIVTLKELDKLKRNPDISYAVRQAIKAVDEGIREGYITVDLQHYTEDSPDEKILTSVQDGILLTQDVGMRAIARSKGITLADDFSDDWDKDYKGYEVITLEDEDIFYKSLPHFKEYQIPEFEEIIGKPTILNCYYALTVESNGSYYLFKRKEDRVIKSVYTEKTFRQAGVSHIQFLHAEQHCVFDAVMDDTTPLTVIQGRLGSSKTLMSLLGALAQTKGLAQKRYARFDKIYITRAPTSIERALELGFDRGSIETKMQQWMISYKTNLEFLFNVTEKDRLENTGEQIYQKFFKPLSLESIQGASLNNSILLVDEAQLLSQNALKQVMGRVAQNSKLIIIFDPEQAYGVNRGNEGYKKLMPYLKGNPLISYVNLQNIYRSELTRLVDEMFK